VHTLSKVLLITNQPPAQMAGGRAMLCRLNRDALQDLVGSQLVVVELLRRSVSGGMEAARALLGEIDGINQGAIEHVSALLADGTVTRVFIDGSNLGMLARTIKHRFPHVEVITFFHNVEARFFYGALRKTRTLHAAAVMIANYLAERSSVRHSDKRICLSERDSHLLRRLYGRSATHVAPIALHDRAPEGPGASDPPAEKFALFVGGMFYANEAGIAWYAEHVAPKIGMRTCVVGHGTEALRDRLELHENITVVGSVSSLADWYQRAHVVVAPIFDGSGMKTKVAEALMYGKRVIGTPEAFSGYEDLAQQAGEVCQSAEEFAVAINRSEDLPYCMCDPQLRMLYLQMYSFAAARKRLQAVLSDQPFQQSSWANS
jgi:glycosyltransferase involved in cell wall biosynthesis